MRLSVINLLVAIGQRIGVRVVEQSVVSIAPGKFLEGENAHTFTPDHFFIFGVKGCRRAETHLGAETQVGIWHKLWLFVRMGLALHVSVEPADTNTRQSHREAQYLPGPCCGKHNQ